MHRMKHISAVPAGYLVRKTVNGRLYQSFFGESRYGSSDAALNAAIAYRDSLLKEVAGERTFQDRNARNITGIVGVAWHCRHNTHRNGAVVHSFRAQVSGDDGKTLSKAWSVQRYGLWGAYEQAARWRHMVAFGRAMKESDIVNAFIGFLESYQAQMEQAGDLQMEMRDALVDLALDPNVPREVMAALPHHIQKRFENKKSRLQLVSSQPTSRQANRKNKEREELDLYDTNRTGILSGG